MENENPRVPPLWEHSLTTLYGHDPTSDPGMALSQWVHFHGVHNLLDLTKLVHNLLDLTKLGPRRTQSHSCQTGILS